jgi:hypothetical protein
MKKSLKTLWGVSVIISTLVFFVSCGDKPVESRPKDPDPVPKYSPTITVGAIPSVLPGDTSYGITFTTTYAVNVKANGVLLNKTSGTYVVSGAYLPKDIIIEAISGDATIAPVVQTVTMPFASKVQTDLSFGGTYVMYRNEGRGYTFSGWTEHPVPCFNLDFFLDKTLSNNRNICTPAQTIVPGSYELLDDNTKLKTSFQQDATVLWKASRDTLCLLYVSGLNDSTRYWFKKQ